MNSLNGQIVPILETYLPKSRVAHSMRVAETAQQLATRWNISESHIRISPEKAYKAGLLHDIAKAMCPQKLCDLGISTTPWYENIYKSYPAVWHAFAGPKMIEQLMGTQDPDIMKAIRHHTTGAGRMTPLEKILYISDYIEPGRPFEDRKNIASFFEDTEANITLNMTRRLTLATTIIVTGSIISLSRQQKAIHPLTLRCYNALSINMTDTDRQQIQAHITQFY